MGLEAGKRKWCAIGLTLCDCSRAARVRRQTVRAPRQLCRSCRELRCASVESTFTVCQWCWLAGTPSGFRARGKRASSPMTFVRAVFQEEVRLHAKAATEQCSASAGRLYDFFSFEHLCCSLGWYALETLPSLTSENALELGFLLNRAVLGDSLPSNAEALSSSKVRVDCCVLFVGAVVVGLLRWRRGLGCRAI